MISVSRRWQALLGGMVRWGVVLELSRDGKKWVTVAPTTCTVTEDAGQQTRFQLEAEAARVDESLMSVFGSMARVWVINLETGEKIQKGLYRVDVRRRTVGSSLFRINGVSFEQHLIDARYPTPKVIPAGTAEATMKALIEDVLPKTKIKFLRKSDALHLMPKMTVDRDRWEAIDGKDGSTSANAPASIAKALGCRVWASHDGSLIVGPPTSLKDEPLWTIRNGQGGTQLSAAEGMSRSSIFNGVSVRGLPRVKGKDGAVGEVKVIGPFVVVDGDPKSATYWDRSVHDGGFGKVPVFYASPLLTTRQQCLAVAESMLAPRLGARKELEVGMMFDPSKEAGDIGRVVNFDGSYEKVVLDSITYDFIAMTMDVKCRASASDEAGKTWILIDSGDDEGGEDEEDEGSDDSK